VVQTGPKSQLGGVQAGFWRAAYQVGIWEMVAKLPMPPAARQRVRKAKRARAWRGAVYPGG
jgi:hypothetical protein